MGGTDGDHGSLPGRDREQALLARALQSAAEGSPRALFVHGEAGVGKTRLVRETCQASQLRPTWGSCVRFAAAEVPYTPIAGVLQDWLNTAGPTERDEVLAGADDLAALLPSIGFGTAIAGGRLVPLVDLVISRLADRRPTVVVVDDLQWADAASLDVLAYLIAGFRNQPLALIATCRDEARSETHPLHGWLADMRRMPSFEEIHLERLDLESTADQIAGLTQHPRDLELAAQVQAMSDGNPYLTELLVRDLPDPQAAPIAVPDALRDALLAQWHGLTRESRDLTRLLAAAGRPVPLAVLTRVAGEHGINPEYVTDCLTEAETHGVIESTSGTPWFRHPLIADILYDGLPLTAAGKVHATYVRVLEATPDAAAADLAAHSHLAGRTDDAYRWSLQAADDSRRLGAPAEEAIHLRRACDLWESVSDPIRGSVHDRIRLLRRTSSTYSKISEPGEASALLDQAVDLVDRRTEPLLAAAILTSRSTARWSANSPSTPDLADAQDAVDLSSSDPDSPEHAMALAELAALQVWNDPTASSRYAGQAVAAAERSGSDEALTRALCKRAAATCVTSPPDALTDATRAAHLALSHGNLRDLQDATIWRLNALAELSRYDEFLAEGLTAYRQLIDGGAGKSCHFLLFMLTDGLLDNGRWDEARAMIRTALAARCGGISGAGVRLAATLLAVRSGQVAEARLHLERAEELVPSSFPGLQEGFKLCGAATLLADGKPRDALDWLKRCVPTGDQAAEDLGDDVLVAYAQVAAELARTARDHQDPAEVAEAIATLDEVLAGWPTEPFSAGTPAATMHRALFEAERERCRAGGDQPDRWLDAAAACRETGNVWGEAQALFRFVESGLGEGRPASTLSDSLRAAYRPAVQMGAMPLRRDIEGLAVRSRISLAEPAPAVNPGWSSGVSVPGRG
ncbi:hypothetical protein E0H73_11575 [Kribbella pittospori]|uniref:Orc1-like AAA ATPase domain-containing protein n=1 Tax=Kribbella pittospori TaxID=722689 RepID=A0A4R0KU83_9ACTN|nr:AAA family ATPase [Kribbella pittospori]TCC63104.1 hypothetical protein E0H73_11575 [Kribbella pittospori]